jgi:hypothetical protein
MNISDLTVEVRNSSLARVGQLLPVDLVGFKAVIRFRNVGTWEIQLPVGHAMAEELRQPNAGLIVTLGSSTMFSGFTTKAIRSQTQDDPQGQWLISGVTDDAILGERLAYPDPSTADITAQGTEYDVRTGTASTVIYGYVTANIGASAPAARKITGLTTATDTGIGSMITGRARFETLGSLIEQLSVIDGLGFDLKQVGSNLVFQVYEPTDRSATVRMDIENNRLTKSEYTYSTPEVTRAIVAGTGTGTARLMAEVTTTDSAAAETAWGRRIEVFKDARSSTEAELTQAGTAELAEKGKTLEAISVSPSDDLTMAYGSDWYLGDKISVVAGTTTISQIVTEVALVITEDGVRIGATVGQPEVAAASTEPEAAIVSTQVEQEQRISNLERNEPERIAENIEVLVKNSTGATLTAGTVVYVSSANGTNILVSKSQANSEATSSKTLGLVKTDIANNDFGYVVSYGILSGLNTSAAGAEGDPVWLSPTTAGGMVFGLANKPVAPNHMVYLGIVTRKNSSNGEIQIVIQNGFELEELHNVLITSAANNNVLVYESASGLWKNKTAANAGLATTTDLSGYATTATVNTKAPLSYPTFSGTVVIPTLSVSGTATITGATTMNEKPVITTGGGEVLKVGSNAAATSAFIGFYKNGSATRTGYVGQGSTSNAAMTISSDTDGCSMSFGNDGSPRVYSADIYARTYTSNPTVCVTTAGTLGRVTSASKYKLDIEDKETDIDRILSINPKTWLDKSTYEKNQRFLAALAAGEDVSQFAGYSADWVQPRVAGLIAEEVEAAGLGEYVFYGEPDENGNREIEGIQYDRVWIELLPVVQKQRDEINELKSMVTALADRVSQLEGK